MTTSELKNVIAESKFAERYNNITVVFEIPYLNYRNEIKGLSAIFEFVSNQITAFKDQKYKEIIRYIENSRVYYDRILTEISNFQFSSNSIGENSITYLERNLKQYISEIRNYYPFVYNCPEIEFLIDIKSKYPNSLDSAFTYITGNNSFNINNKDHLIGYLLAFNFFNKDNADSKRLELDKKVITENKKFFDKYLMESESQLSAFLRDSKVKYDEHITDLQSFKDEKQKTFDEWFGKSSDNFSNFFRTSNQQFENISVNSTKKIATLENTYEELLRLKKPAEYWRLRAEDLKKQGWRSLYWLIALVAFTASMLFVLLWLTPDDMLITIFSQDKSKAIRWSIVFLAFLSVLIYGIRTLNKVTFSSFHLARDAEEREQLTHVYLSLINEKAMDKEDRLLIMQSLFSRADTGLLKEDSSPSMPGAASVVEKFIK